MNWIDIKESLPEHHENVLCKSNKGYCVTTFVCTKMMNEAFARSGLLNLCRDPKKEPYFFVSQEDRSKTLNGITHWLRLPPIEG